LQRLRAFPWGNTIELRLRPPPASVGFLSFENQPLNLNRLHPIDAAREEASG